MYAYEIWYFDPVWDEPTDPPVGDPPADPPADPPPADNKKFTQDDVNNAVAKERRQQEQRYKKRIEQLETIRDGANLSQEQVDSLNQQISDMESEHKTKEQLAQEESVRVRKEHERQTTKLTSEKDLWQGRYTNMVVVNSITNASIENDAFSPEQVVALLQPSTRLVEVVDEDGKKTGELEPKTKFNGLDEEGNEIELDITPSNAVKRMTEMDKYANLFKGSKTGGLGAEGGNRGGGGLGDLTNTDNYMKQRKAGKLK